MEDLNFVERWHSDAFKNRELAYQIYDDVKNNAIWGYRASLDAKEYVNQCNGAFDKINLINNYDWLEIKSNACVEDWQKL